VSTPISPSKEVRLVDSSKLQGTLAFFFFQALAMRNVFPHLVPRLCQIRVINRPFMESLSVLLDSSDSLEFCNPSLQLVSVPTPACRKKKRRFGVSIKATSSSKT
jgi:hypothetical protein